MSFAEFRSLLNNKCLDIAGSNQTDGTNVLMWQCHGGDNQQWIYDPATEQFKTRLNNMCLTVNGSNVQVATCKADDIRQQWYFDKTSKALKSRSNNLCLDIQGGYGEDGGNVIMWDCHGQANQQWASAREDMFPNDQTVSTTTESMSPTAASNDTGVASRAATTSTTSDTGSDTGSSSNSMGGLPIWAWIIIGIILLLVLLAVIYFAFFGGRRQVSGFGTGRY